MKERKYYRELTPEQRQAATHFGHKTNWVKAGTIQKLERAFKMPGVWLKDGKVTGVLSGAL